MKIDFKLETLQEYCTNLYGNACTRSVTDTLRNLKVQSYLSEVFNLTKVILVLPATNVTSERTFRMLKLINSYLRSKMKQGWLNHLTIFSVYKIASDFINRNDAPKHIFGEFNPNKAGLFEGWVFSGGRGGVVEG